MDNDGLPLALVERWDGTGWKIEGAADPSHATPGHATPSVLSGISCTSPRACEAVGAFANAAGANQPLAERWNGTSWTLQSVPKPTGASSAQLSQVSCFSATVCMAVGPAGLAERWDGHIWTVTPTPTIGGSKNGGGGAKGQLYGVSCTSRSACTAVGALPSTTGQSTVAERWNGHIWQNQSTPTAGPSAQLLGVSCTRANACTSVGSSTTSDTGQQALAEGWNGTKRALERVTGPPNTLSSLIGVSCTSATACTAVGTSSITTTSTLAEGLNGTTWTIETTPNPAGATSSGLFGVSCATGCTAVGASQNAGGASTPLAERLS
jgi:hypothetical protein